MKLYLSILCALSASFALPDVWPGTLTMVARAAKIRSMIKNVESTSQTPRGHTLCHSESSLTNALRVIADYDTSSVRIALSMCLIDLTDRDIVVIFLLNRVLFDVPVDVMLNTRAGKYYQLWYTSTTADAPFLRRDPCGCLAVAKPVVAEVMTGFRPSVLLSHFDVFASTFPRRSILCLP